MPNTGAVLWPVNTAIVDDDPLVGLTLRHFVEKAGGFGACIEDISVYDAIGGSMGFRRPGYTMSVEPSISWTYKNNTLSVYAPVAVDRNREGSAPEIALGRPGGDAAFADYSILASFTHRF